MTEPLADDDDKQPCGTCEGEGVVERSRSGHPMDPDTWNVPCPDCCPEAYEGPDPDQARDDLNDRRYEKDDDDSR